MKAKLQRNPGLAKLKLHVGHKTKGGKQVSDIIEFFISKFRELLAKSPQPSIYYQPRPYRNAAVRFRACSLYDFEERRRLLEECGLNIFMFPASKIAGCDLLTDSGTTAMTMEQWSQLLLGDESYGSNEGYFELKEQVTETFGPSWKQESHTKQNLFIFHQGRAAEHATFTTLASELLARGTPQARPLSNELIPELKTRIENKISQSRGAHFIIPNNSHFDTTEANVSSNNMVPLNLPCREYLANDEAFPFKGNINLDELESLLANEHDRVPLVYITITNNTAGGQPVSLENIKKARKITSDYGVPLFFDACRFAENAWFIQQKEKRYKNKSIEDIIKEMFECVDGFTISFKKDGLVNMGGGLLIRDDGLFFKAYPDIRERLTDFQILVEGHPTYGGLAGRDLKGLVEGLKTVVRTDYLEHRIRQVQRFGNKLIDYGIPIVRPIGAHAVYIDIDRFFEATENKDEDLKGQAFTDLLLIAGHRVCELGLYVFGKYKDGKEIPPDPRVNLVRIAVPRLVYEDQDLLAVAEAIKVLHDNNEKIPGVEVVYGKELRLRHFKSRFRFKHIC